MTSNAEVEGMVRRLHAKKLLLPLLLSLQCSHAFAVSDGGPQVAEKHLLPSAVRIQVTPRGMRYFDTRLSDILGNLGVNLDEGYFPAMKYTFDKDINPDDYENSNPEAVKMYKQVRDLLTQWLVGFSMNNHRPVIEIGESGYIAQFARFGLVTDEALMNALGKRDGAVLAIELEIKQLTVSTNSVIAWDLNNKFLGKAGLENITISAGSAQTPLKVRLPFYVRMNASGGLDFEALEIENNLKKTPLTLKYQKLIIPTFAVEVNKKKYYLNNKEVDKFFNSHTPEMLEKIRENLGEFAQEQLPAILNGKAKEFLGGTLEQVQNMSPPGKDASDTRPDFKWGLQLQNINLKNSLNIDLTAYVEDSLNSRSAPLKSHASRGAPVLNLLPQDKYDIALSLDRALVNRVLQLSFERRNFEQIRQSDGATFKLMATPLIDFIKAPVGYVAKPQETFLKLRVAVENRPDSVFLKDKIVVEFDIIAKLRQMSDKAGVQIVLLSIDADSMYLDDKYISFAGALFKNKVRNAVKEELSKKDDGWKKTEEIIPGGFPLPPEIMGIKLDINHVAMDPNGHLVMYLDYAKLGVKK